MRHICQSQVLIICFFAIVFQACRDEITTDLAGRSARLQAVTFIDDQTLAVSDTAYYEGEWEEGRVILIDLSTQERLGAWYSPITNPQALQSDADSLAVLSSGELSLGEQPQGSWSNLSLLKLNDRNILELKQGLSVLSSPKGAYWVDLAKLEPFSDNQSGWSISSGIDAVLWQASMKLLEPTTNDEANASSVHEHLQLELKAQRYASSEVLSLASVVQWNEYSLLIDFNQDRLYLIDQQGNIAPCSPELGRFEGVMEGAQNPFVHENRLWISFGLSGRLIHIDLDQLEPQLDRLDCQIEPQVYSPPLGQVPNDLKVIDDQVYVLHSAESALWTYSVDTGERTSQRALPKQSNPWQMALSPNGQFLAITEWLSGGVTLLNLNSEARLNRLAPQLFSKPKSANCYVPINHNIPSKLNEALAVTETGLVLKWPKQASQEEQIENLNDKLSNSTIVSSLDLQGAPQLALLFTNSSPIHLDVQLQENDEWIRLKPLKNDLSIQVNAEDLEKDLAEDDSIGSSWLFTKTQEATDSMFKPYPQRGLFTSVEEVDDVLSEIKQDSCPLFKPKYKALTLDLHSLLKPSAHHLNLEFGKIPLYALRISTESLGNDEQALLAIAFRRWP